MNKSKNLETSFTHFLLQYQLIIYHEIMALQNDWDDLMADVEWEESEIDSGYFDSDNEAGNPGS